MRIRSALASSLTTASGAFSNVGRVPAFCRVSHRECTSEREKKVRSFSALCSFVGIQFVRVLH